MNPFGLCGVLLHILCNYFMTKGVFFICDALLDVDHFFLGQRQPGMAIRVMTQPSIGRPYLMARVIQKMPLV